MSAYNLLIDGKMVPGDQTMPVLNPATEEVLAQCPRASKEQLDKAVAAAKAAYPAWAATPMAERRQLVIKMADVIEANAGELARILTSEQGKPLADATGEVMGMAAFFRYLGLARTADARDRELRRPQGRGLSPSARRGRRHHSLELSASDPQFQAAVGAARRQHAGGEARADHAAGDAALRGTDQGHPAQGRAQRHRRRQRSRRRT